MGVGGGACTMGGPPLNQQTVATNEQGFYFKPRREKLNWRIMSAIDIEKLIDDVDIETLESITKNITFSRIDYHGMCVCGGGEETFGNVHCDSMINI